MSLDIYVYSPDERPADIARLAETAKADGWEIRLLRGRQDWKTYDVVNGELLTDADEICGWRTKDPRSPVVEEAIEKRLESVIKQLLLRGAFGDCLCFINSDIEVVEGPDSGEASSTGDEEIEDEDHPEFLNGLFSPKTVYTLNIGPGSGSCSGELFERLGPWLAKLHRGAWYDPQSDEHQIYHDTIPFD